MLVGNKKTQNLLEDIVSSKECSHAYLFVGPSGVGKTTFAKNFAKNLICESNLACGSCRNCLLFDSGNHPDVIVNDDAGSLTVEVMRSIVDSLGLKPYQASKKVLILANAERMTTSAANSLLKTLEEPTNETVIILTTANQSKLLPTIISRVQQIKFTHLSNAEVDDYLQKKGCEQIGSILPISLNRIGLADKLMQSREDLERIDRFIHDFDEIISDKKIWEKLKFAEKMSKEKEDISLYLDLLEAFYENMLHEKGADMLKISSILDKLTRTRDLISKNVNQKLVFESLLLGDI